MVIDDFDVRILGFTGVVDSVDDLLSDLDGLSGNDDSVVQLLDADGIAGKKHVLHAVNQSILAFDRGDNFANDLGVEVCLRCSAQRQISKAFRLLGLKKGKMNLCAILINGNNKIIDYLNDKFERNDDVLLPVSSNLINIFDLMPEECNSYAYEDIVIDRISKLAVDY
ncbi:MAG: KEOPS complex subunit Cgi121 [Methanobrevibacter sp.]|uniref:KEOPS complex subunit Cgi121 n=1 Tax=Methanobrevibacter sp. TaxID=66852 RepID=UPI0026E0FE71|nr:KEOPS complex subunit Cgi121 [Methanobrevibacter sp.]MDO5848982.1 KEOPS complex subunit Cgi121 [Methanobrevibacter sp.]